MFAVLSQFRHITVFTLPALRGNTVQFFPVTAVIQRFYFITALLSSEDGDRVVAFN